MDNMMSQELKGNICILIVAIPYISFAIHMPLGIILLLPLTLMSLILKKLLKIKFEDGTTKGDIKLLLFGTLAFFGIPGGILCWMLLYVVTS